MASDSYTLREVAELLGVSKRTLQRRIQEGAFPGRFLAPGRHGLETRIPAEDVQRALDDLRRRGHGAWGQSAATPMERRRPPTVTPAREIESLVPYQAPDLVSSSGPSSSSLGAIPVPMSGSALTSSDLESLRDAMLAIIREDREVFLMAVRDSLAARDREISGLKQEVSSMRRVLDAVRGGVESLERRIASARDAGQNLDVRAWADMLLEPVAAEGRAKVDIDGLLRELGELESMIVAMDRE